MKKLSLLFVSIAMLSLSACGSDTGPSYEKVRLDLIEIYSSKTPFSILSLNRRVLSEDRVEFHVKMSYKDVYGGIKTEKAIFLYRIRPSDPAGIWRISNSSHNLKGEKYFSR